MLLRNARSDGGGPMRFTGGGSGHAVARSLASFGDAAGIYGWADAYSGIPDGTRIDGTFVSPLDDGGLGADIFAASSLTAGVTGEAAIAAAIAGLATVAAAANRGVQISSTILGAATVTAAVNAIGNLLARIEVNQVTQTDIESAVLQAQIEGGLTLRDVLRIILAVQVGKSDIAAGPVVTFRDQADTKNRVTATMAGSERASVTLDPS